MAHKEHSMGIQNWIEVISRNDFDQIHDASVRILEDSGVRFHCPEALEQFKAHGAKVEGETVFISRQMVADALKTTPHSFLWSARNPERNVTVGQGFLVQPNVGPVFIQDLEGGRRLAKLEDYANIIKLCHSGEMIHLNGTIPVDPSDVPAEEKHLFMMYEILRNTDKPIIGFCSEGEKALESIEMVEMAVGSRDFLENHHCVGVLVNPLSPLGFARETIETIMTYAARNQIILLAPCIMAGISGPISLLGTAVLQNVEILAGLVLAQTVRPGAPVVYATASTAGYMKNGSFAAGSPEAMLINTPNLQMGREYYHLPTRTMCGITHAKEIDCQAGYETMMSLLLGVLSGANIGVQCVGTLDALMTVSYEKIIIDQELISRALRFRNGVEPVSEESLAVEVIRQVGSGGNYMAHPSTFRQCRSLWNPSVSNWESYDAWHAAGDESLVVRANKKYKEILAKAPETLIEQGLDKELKRYINRKKELR
jgi:trimethylamine---corrinoid protein Co-methyltransferase